MSAGDSKLRGKFCHGELTLSLGEANQLEAPSSRERSGAHHIGCLTGLLNRDSRPVVFEHELRGQWINGLVTDETCARMILASE